MFTATLPKNAQTALALLGRTGVLPAKTYLAGGSALALQLGHRVSVDFDFFTPESFNQRSLAKKLSTVGKFKTSQEAKETLLGNFQKVHFSIFTYQYPLLKPPADFLGIKIASPQDIAAMKIEAVMTRGAKKDFLDLYFLNENGFPLEQCLEFYDQKYKILESNLYSIILGMQSFDNAHATKIPPMLKKVSWDEAKKFFRQESLRLAKKFL